MILKLYDIEGKSLGVIQDIDEPIPRVGETIRVTEGASPGDYEIEHIRWEFPELQGLVLCKRVKTDSWPDPKKAPEFSDPPGGLQ